MHEQRKRAPGAGRKPQGVTRKVSLTLTEEEWETLDTYPGTIAAYIKESIQQKPMASDEKKSETFIYPAENPALFKVPKVSVQMDREFISHIIKIEVAELKRNDEELPSEEDIKRTEEMMLNLLVPKGSNYAQLAVLNQYICPHTNKRFGSAEKMVRAMLPSALKWPANERYRKKVLAISKERAQAPKYWDQI